MNGFENQFRDSIDKIENSYQIKYVVTEYFPYTQENGFHARLRLNKPLTLTMKFFSHGSAKAAVINSTTIEVIGFLDDIENILRNIH